MTKEVTRYIKQKVQTELWARSAGRCQFNGCNRILYQSPITKEPVNISEKAHIYSFSENGPRGWGPLIWNKDELNSIDNLMLMCHDCHKKTDQDSDGVKYSADLLQKWKREHERRVVIVTGIDPSNKTHVVFYGANIGEQKSPIQKEETFQSIFPRHYPVDDIPLLLSMDGSHEDKDEAYWSTEVTHIEKVFNQKILPRIEESSLAHFSVFAMAPMPLLIKLGTLFTDKITVEVHQPIREPKTWQWQAPPDDFGFDISTPDTNYKNPVLIMSLSAKIDHDRIKEVLGEKVDIWEISTSEKFQHNDFLKSVEQLSIFRTGMRKLIGQIVASSGNETPLHIFPAMPIACSIELGRVRMPKADMPWVIYDQNYKMKTFIKALQI